MNYCDESIFAIVRCLAWLGFVSAQYGGVGWRFYAKNRFIDYQFHILFYSINQVGHIVYTHILSSLPYALTLYIQFYQIFNIKSRELYAHW